MALSHRRWGITMALLVAMAITAAPDFCGAVQSDDIVDLAESAPVAKAGRGRFLASFDEVTPIGRKLLNFNLCGGAGTSTSNNCKSILPFARDAECCTDPNTNIKLCWDVGLNYSDKCGSCTNRCRFGQFCCRGVCSTLRSDPKNCGYCGHVCKGVPCKNGMCGYN